MSSSPSSGLTYYVLDVETNGLKCNYHEITQISIIRCDDRHQINKFVKIDYPQRSSQESLDITGRTMSDLMKGDSRIDVINACNAFIEKDGLSPAHRCMIGHNVSFDRRFCHAMWEQEDKIFPANVWLDTSALTRMYAKSIGLIKPKLNLDNSLRIFGIKPITGAHDAKIDTQNTYRLWKTAVDKHQIDYLPKIKVEPHKGEEDGEITEEDYEEDC